MVKHHGDAKCPAITAIIVERIGVEHGPHNGNDRRNGWGIDGPSRRGGLGVLKGPTGTYSYNAAKRVSSSRRRAPVQGLRDPPVRKQYLEGVNNVSPKERERRFAEQRVDRSHRSRGSRHRRYRRPPWTRGEKAVLVMCLALIFAAMVLSVLLFVP
jgi:hypothetical protein